MGVKDDVDMIAVTDSKRNRVEDRIEGECTGDKNDQILTDQSNIGPKNRKVVGSGLQAHHT